MSETIALTLKANDEASVVVQRFVSNAEKAFQKVEAASSAAVSKIKNGWNSLKGAWVEVAALIYTLKEAWNSMDMAAQFQEQMESIDALAAAHKTSAASIVSGIKDVTKGMVSMADAADIAGGLLLKNLTPEQIVNIAKAAEVFSNVTGKKVTESFKNMAEALATGKTKSIEAAIGIIDLKAQYGDLAERMTEAQKAQAMYNIVMERAQAIQQQLGDSGDSYGDRMERLTATVKNLNLYLGTFFLRAVAGAIGGFQWLSAGIMAFYGNLVKVISYGFWVLSKLSITKEARDDAAGLYQSLKAEAAAMDEGAQDLIGKSLQNFEAMVAKSGDLSAVMKGVSIGTSGGTPITKLIGEAIDSQLKMVEGEIKADPPSLNVSVKLNPRLMGEVDKYWDDVDAAIKEAYSAASIASEAFYAETGVVTTQYFNDRVAQITEIASYWQAQGVDEVAVQKWAQEEILKLEEERISKTKKLEEDKQKSWIAGMQDYQSSLSAISSGSLSQIAGLFGQYGQMAGAIIELISNIGDLPNLLKESISALVQGAKDFGPAVVEIIQDIVTNLPAITTEIITSLVDSADEIIAALIEALPTFVEQFIKSIPVVIAAFVKEIPQIITVLIEMIPELVVALAEGLWDAIKFIFTGGTLESTVSDWTSDTTVAVELDTTEAMNALTYAQDALLGALNDTDRAVAREALLSAREAAILADSTTSDGSSVAEDLSTTFDGLFSLLGEWLSDLFDGLWDWLTDLGGVIGDMVDALIGFIGDLLSAIWDVIVDIASAIWDALVDVFKWAWDVLGDTLSWAWDGLVDVFEWAWDGLSDVFDWFAETLSDLFDWLASTLSDAWDWLVGNEDTGDNGILDDWFGYGDSWSFHKGGVIPKAHTGMFIGGDKLASYEVPIIAKVGEGVLNDYNGMKAIGGEAGLNYANTYGTLPGRFHQGGVITAHDGAYIDNSMPSTASSTQVSSSTHVTQHQYFSVVVDKDGNAISLTKTQAKNLARTLDPVFAEMNRNGELSFV